MQSQKQWIIQKNIQTCNICKHKFHALHTLSYRCFSRLSIPREHKLCDLNYHVRRIAHKRVIRLSIKGSTTSTGSFGKAKNPSVACNIYQKIYKASDILKLQTKLNGLFWKHPQLYMMHIDKNLQISYLQYMVSSFNC